MQRNEIQRRPLVAVVLTGGLFLALWLIWSLWQHFMPPQRPMLLADVLLAKPLVWGVIPLAVLFRSQKSTTKQLRGFFEGQFPIFPCIVFLCSAAAFLHTIRLLQGLGNSFVIFNWMMVLSSLSAGVVEELGFRGCFFTRHRENMSFWPAAVLNGLIFTAYHYTELLFGGDFDILLSWRPLLIFTMGILFCWMFHKWKNLALNMVVHIVWDILSFLFCLG